MEIAFKKTDKQTENIVMHFYRAWNSFAPTEEGQKREEQRHNTKQAMSFASCCYEQENQLNNENRSAISDINNGNDQVVKGTNDRQEQ